MKVEIIKNEKKFIDDKVVLVDFPELIGSEKHIAYAKKIRQEKVATMEKAYINFRSWMISYDGEKAQYLSKMDKEKNDWFNSIYIENGASFWINFDEPTYIEIEKRFQKYIQE